MYVNNGSVEGDRNCEANHLLWNDRIGVLKISLGVMNGVTESGGASEELEGTEIASLLPVGDMLSTLLGVRNWGSASLLWSDR